MGKLIDNHIYPIPAGDIFGYDKDRVFILYAPFSGCIALALPNEVEGLDADNTEYKNILDSFQAKGEIKIDKIPQKSSDIWQIDLLNNYTCNFHCVYCYSAKGRSNKQIEWMKVKVLIDYLFAHGKDITRPYQINFSGGGEPLMSYDLIKQTVLYIEQINKEEHYPYNFGIVTNGSLIRPDIIDFFIEHQVDMAVSFEIFKDLQNAERGSYDRVVENIDYMLERGYPFGIRTTLTPLSVHRMKAMVEEVATRFPKLKTMVFDVVLDPSLFSQPHELEAYYDAFLRGFYEAKSIAQHFGIRVESNAVELLGIFRARYCLGKIVLTPEGSLSVCARVSSPKESPYTNYTYGKVENGKVNIDEDKLQSILTQNNIYTLPTCDSCFAKWNCGGGCQLFNEKFNSEYQRVRCDFVRKALRYQLWNILLNRDSGGKLVENVKACLKQ